MKYAAPNRLQLQHFVRVANASGAASPARYAFARFKWHVGIMRTSVPPFWKVTIASSHPRGRDNSPRVHQSMNLLRRAALRLPLAGREAQRQQKNGKKFWANALITRRDYTAPASHLNPNLTVISIPFSIAG